jgi:hypothetical protein
MDVVTPIARQAVEMAIAVDDRATLERYGRFLGPITDRIVAGRVDAAMERRIGAVANRALLSYRARSTTCD